MPTPRVLREYALVADGERGAVIGPDGSIAWLCVPRWDSPAAFSGLLGGPGQYTITPADPWHVWGGYYESGSLIWRNRWVGDTRIECREALAMPADPHRAVLLRRIEAIDGAARSPPPSTSGQATAARRMTGLKRHGEPGPAAAATPGSAGRARARRGSRTAGRMRVELARGRRTIWCSSCPIASSPTEPPDPGGAGRRPRRHGRPSSPDCDDLIALADARHSYAVLRGLTSASGAMVAAATTSLPERLEGGRNYDYRYAWIRDQCYAGIAVAAHGPHPLLTGALRFVTERLLDDGPELMPAYTVAGEPIGDEVSLAARLPRRHARRELGARAVPARRAGRDAVAVRRRRAPRHARRDDWRAAAVAADGIGNAGSSPTPASGSSTTGAGRTPGSPACPGCADRGRRRRRAPGGHGHREAAQWSGLADSIAAACDAVHPSGRWQRAPDDERVDAALLMP